VDGLLLSLGKVEVVMKPRVDATVGSPVLKTQDNDNPSVAIWAFSKGSVAARTTLVPQGVFLNLTMSLLDNCSCQTDAGISLGISGLRESLESIIVSTTPVSQVPPPTTNQTLIEAMDYAEVDRLYGVAAAFVLNTGNTLEVVSLYPFSAISYDPTNDSIGLLFRKGRGDLSTSAFQSGDAQSVMFYVGAANSQQTPNNAFLAFASDLEVAFPTVNFGKPFILYGVEDGSWDNVRQEAESFGYTIPYSDYTSEYTHLNGGGHYFGLGCETTDHLEQAGLESAMVLESNGQPDGNGVDVRVNPSELGLLTYIENEIDSHLATRNWFLADGVDVVQDFNPQHSNVLEGYMQALLYVRSTGKGIIYNSFHTPRLWLDWLSDAVEVEAPTSLIHYDGTRIDYLSSGEFFDVTREFIRIHYMFFPKRIVVWHDYLSSLDPSEITSNGASIDTSQSVFGGASGKFIASSSQYLTVPNSTNWYYGTGNFTVDFWVRFNTLPASGSSAYVYSQFQDYSNYVRICFYNYGSGMNVVFGVYQSGSWLISYSVDGGAFSTATWYHMAVVRNGNAWYWFKNGTRLGSTGTSTGSVPDLAAPLLIGTFDGASGFLDGWLDEFRISKGIARWTSNFTPPTAPYDRDSYTVLLLHMDGSNGNTTFLEDGTAENTINSSVTDSMAFALMEGAGSFSFSTSQTGHVSVRPGEITIAMSLLTKMDSIRQLRLGECQAHIFVPLDTGGWTFEALSVGSATWLGKLNEVLVGDVSIPVNFDGTYSTFNVQPSQLTVIPSPL
jgi:hypothetical protein